MARTASIRMPAASLLAVGLRLYFRIVDSNSLVVAQCKLFGLEISWTKTVVLRLNNQCAKEDAKSGLRLAPNSEGVAVMENKGGKINASSAVKYLVVGLGTPNN